MAQLIGPRDIAAIASVPTSGELPIVVAGQAVNFWAEWYGEKLGAALASLQPFLSKDLDLWGPVSMLENLAAAYRVPVNLAPPRLPVIGNIFIKNDANAEPIKVEFIHSVYGLKPEEIGRSFSMLLADGRRISVLEPVMCLKAKVSNAAAIEQTGRQDVKHVKIMAVCAKQFTKETLVGLHFGNNEKRILKNLQDLHSIINSRQAQTVKDKWNISLQEVLPIEEMRECPLPKIQNFVRYQFDKNSKSS